MAPGGLVEVRVSWPGHPRYLKKKNNNKKNKKKKKKKMLGFWGKCYKKFPKNPK